MASDFSFTRAGRIAEINATTDVFEIKPDIFAKRNLPAGTVVVEEKPLVPSPQIFVDENMSGAHLPGGIPNFLDGPTARKKAVGCFQGYHLKQVAQLMIELRREKGKRLSLSPSSPEEDDLVTQHVVGFRRESICHATIHKKLYDYQD